MLYLFIYSWRSTFNSYSTAHCYQRFLMNLKSTLSLAKTRARTHTFRNSIILAELHELHLLQNTIILLLFLNILYAFAQVFLHFDSFCQATSISEALSVETEVWQSDKIYNDIRHKEWYSGNVAALTTATNGNIRKDVHIHRDITGDLIAQEIKRVRST